MRIASNHAAAAALAELARAQASTAAAATHLASGRQIDTAADDAAGLSISQHLTSSINGIAAAIANARDAQATLSIADGALASVHDVLQRMNDLVVLAANQGAMTAESLAAITQEAGALTQLLDAIAEFTAAGRQRLLDGSYQRAAQVGPHGGETVLVDLSDANVRASTFGSDAVDLTALNLFALESSGGIYTVDGVRTDLAALSQSIASVAQTRAQIGATYNRLEYSAINLHTSLAATTQARSSLVDADMAEQATKFVQGRITTVVAAAVAAQANSAPRTVLRLLDDTPVAGARMRNSPGAAGRARTDSAGPGGGAAASSTPAARTPGGNDGSSAPATADYRRASDTGATASPVAADSMAARQSSSAAIASGTVTRPAGPPASE